MEILGSEGFPKDWPLDGLAERGDCNAALLRELPPIELPSTDTLELFRLNNPILRFPRQAIWVEF